MESFNKFVVNNETEIDSALLEVSSERIKEIKETDELISREECNWEILNNFYLYFIDCSEGNGWIEKDKRVGWFETYLATHGEQYYLLREILNAAHEAATEAAGDIMATIGDKEANLAYHKRYDSVFLPVLDSLTDQIYEQYVGMYQSITQEDLDQYSHRNTKVGLLGH